jgi:hypothetical protein
VNDAAAIQAFASTISVQPLGLVAYRPEDWALPTMCFGNVIEKIRRSGGRLQPGWFFQCRAVEHLSGARYLIAVHHAVWHSTDGALLDLTPFHPDPKHRPYAPGGNVLFLLDDKSPAVVKGNVIGPMPSRFSALDANEALSMYLQKLTVDEIARCSSLFAQA